jgi:methylated-DNA-[protein]-cysteine S-methyltransferase
MSGPSTDLHWERVSESLTDYFKRSLIVRTLREDVNLERVEFAVYPSSIGTMLVVAKEGLLARLDVLKGDEYTIAKSVRALFPGAVSSDRPFTRLRVLLNRYLKGEPVDFDVPVDLSRETDFSRAVLDVTRSISYGETSSYRWVAEKLGRPRAARAVGQALKRNPIPIVIPCHRVIREDGSIGGFSLEGVRKEYLLGLEGALDKRA